MSNLIFAVVLLGFGSAAIYEFFHKRDGRWAALMGAAGAVIVWLALM